MAWIMLYQSITLHVYTKIHKTTVRDYQELSPKNKTQQCDVKIILIAEKDPILLRASVV